MNKDSKGAKIRISKKIRSVNSEKNSVCYIFFLKKWGQNFLHSWCQNSWILALFTCISTPDISPSKITRTKGIRTAVIRVRVTVTSTLSSKPQKDAIVIVWSVIWEKLSFARRDKFFLSKYPSFEIALFPGTKPDLILTFYVDRSTTVRIVIFTISSIFLVYVFSVNISPVCVTFVEMIEDFHINRLEFGVFGRPAEFSIKDSILRILFNKIYSMKKSSLSFLFLNFIFF